MKRILIPLLLFMLLIIPAEAQDCMITGSFEGIIENMNLIGEMLQDFGYSTSPTINSNKCKFEIISDSTGQYSCDINSSTKMDILTDKNLNPTIIIILGRMIDDMPAETALDWAYAATILACMDMREKDIQDRYIETLKNSIYSSDTITMVSIQDPNYEDTWNYIVANK